MNSLEREIEYLEQELDLSERNQRQLLSELNRLKDKLHLVLYSLEPEQAKKSLEFANKILTGPGILLPIQLQYQLHESVKC